ncbi:hypothetical protein H1P_4350006 [Hyella patelloides LEGE 07179]|uniref:Uncharacterized protein n=1 Tax=Hyella patelloides LEGE 07179 TaxID=945734 RepID=A0A563VY22_9CYAN|nr:hypothetical protein [Hyella patelloides]VEP16321.1 hypothetical protein H1P_4350006 [Hyella patelloides LEGE 07179]
MSNLTVKERNSVLVMDSRLVAENLDIKHKNFLATIEKYKSQIESSFGTLAILTREFQTKQGNSSSERYAYLTSEKESVFSYQGSLVDELTVVSCASSFALAWLLLDSFILTLC